MKKKTIILPLLVFLVGISALMGTVYSVRENQQKQSQSVAELNAMTYAERMKTEVRGGLEITDTLPTRFYCNCSTERVEKAVISVGKKEIQDMIDEGKHNEVKCHFCNTAYNYSVDELKTILKQCKR